MRSAWPSDTARRIGLTGEIEFTTTRVGMTLHVPCKRGDHVVDVTVQPGLNPNGVAKKMLHLGWTLGGRNPVCPECKPRRKKEPAMNGTTNSVSVPPAPPPPPVPSEAAKKAHRLVMMYLEEQYDEPNKRYRPGWSDAKIADETGASETSVKQTREQYFGPLGQPPELEAIKAELNALETAVTGTLDQFKDQIAAAKRRIGDVCRINGWPVE